MTKEEIKKRLKIVCLRMGITRREFVERYYNKIIPISKGGYSSVYAYISTMLSKNSRTKIQSWLIMAIRQAEKDYENSTNKE